MSIISRNIYKWLQNVPLWLFIVILLIIVNAITLCYSFIDSPVQSDELEKNIWFTITVSILFAPILETLLCQFLPIELSQFFFEEKCNKKYYSISIILSAIIFGAIHCYSIKYAIIAFFVGIVLAIGYISRMKYGMWKAFFAIYWVHLFQNLLASIIHIINL